MKKKFEQDDIIELFSGGVVDGLELIEEGSWKVEYKYQYKYLILKDLSDGKTYMTTVSRCGSPFTEYEYTYETDCSEVVKKEKVITYWDKA